MNAEEIREYCLSKPYVTECFPFDEVTLVFKVIDKMFLLLDIESNNASINAKCEPEKAIEYRENYSFVLPGYHMNKKHWNTIMISETNDKILIFSMIDDSYNLVVSKMTKKVKKEYGFE